MAALLQERLADVGLGPRLGRACVSEPMIRYRLVRRRRRRRTALADAGGRPLPAHLRRRTTGWSTPPAPTRRPRSGRLLDRLGVPAVADPGVPEPGGGAGGRRRRPRRRPAVGHLVQREVHGAPRRACRSRARPIDLLWYVSTLAGDRRAPAATKLRRFLATPEAMQAMHRADGGVPAARFRPPVYVTIWS